MQRDSPIWQHHVTVPGTPPGFTVRACAPANPDGIEMMLERRAVGSSGLPGRLQARLCARERAFGFQTEG